MRVALLNHGLFALISQVVFAQNDGWNISTTNSKNYTGIVVANGRIGILPSKKPWHRN